MLTRRPAAERGHANHGWLNSNFSFSFADYYDPRHMGFKALRVINEDYIAPAMGFGKHPHHDMEILTYVLEGSVAHEDSTGASGVLVPGELQHMSAGSGVRHSEFNASEQETLHLLQIWLMPNKLGIAPHYEQKPFSVRQQPDKLHLLASKDGRDDSFVIHSDAELYAAKLNAGAKVETPLRGKNGWVQVARGGVKVNGVALEQGDGLAITDEDKISISSDAGGEVLLFDLE